MITPTQLGLPYTDWRPTQLEAILRASELLRDKRFVVIEAPPGSGKTGIAAGVARFLQVPTVYLTATRDLQAQYHALLTVPTVTGRSNWPCLIDPHLTAAQAKCIGGPCEYAYHHPKYWPGCPYMDQLVEGLGADETVLNYSYFLHSANYAKNFTDRPLIVCDEAHALRGELEGFIQTDLSIWSLRKHQLLGPDDKPAAWGLDQWLAWAWDAIVILNRRLTVPMEREEANLLANLRTSLSTLLAVGGSDNLVMEQLPLARGPKFRPVWVGDFAKQYLFRHAERFLFLTATPGDLNVFCEVLGINPEEAALIRCPSNFDKARRPIIYQPVCRVSGNDVEGSATKLTPVIDSILDNHAEQKGLIHTVSYKLAAAIRQKSRHQDRLVTHMGETREQTLRDFRGTDEPKVILSPSMTTGVDLPYDLLRFQILAKLPFADRSDPVVVAQANDPLGKKLGLQDCALNMAQAYGRIMRSDDDWGTTYLLDGQYEWARHAMKSMIPMWFSEAIIRG